MNQRNAHIIATGSYAPERVVPNSYFNELLGEDVDTWLKEHVQIYSRIDLLIVATDTPEYISPSTASVVQYRLGLHHAATFDVNTACAGFVAAMDIAVKFIKADEHYNNVLVVGAYAMSKYLQEKDKKTITLFADGAGAAILQSKSELTKGYRQSKMLTKGEYHDWMGIYGGASKFPVNELTLQNKSHQLHYKKNSPSFKYSNLE